ncbi:hypothetical protein SLS63_008426 [Diaporthe eres]|uniref:6-phosphofructo-2-kinase domain-containing protein n=1 Tax=Diaporthe eres TaxID=83184 RepID=A0ABR1P2W0_DIAER
MVNSRNIARLNPRPEIGDDLDVQTADSSRTAEIAANAPRYRRKSSTFIDAIHDVTEDQDMAPAQLYSTMSGRLFHSGRIAIVMVGLPARGKTHICVSMARYLAWLGVKTRIFHLGDYRRATVGPGGHVPEDYFFPNATPSSVMLRQKILKKCREDIYAWLNHENGQVAIYDAVNPTAAGRRSLAKEFAKHDVQTLFLESYVNDDRILRENARNVKIHSPDFHGMDPDEAAKLYLRRIEMKIPVFETMNENELNYVKMINAGQGFFYNNVSFNYLSHRIVFYLTNLHIKSRTTFFVRAGAATEEDSYKADGGLSEPGQAYAVKMTETLIKHREQERQAAIEASGTDIPLKPLTSYHDLAVRLEPIILELEREQNDLLIIAHESVLRVLYAYLMHCSTTDIPKLKFPRDEIIEIIPAAYQNEAKRIHIPGLDPRMVPGSPEDIRIPVPSMPPSGTLSPIPGLSSPVDGQATPVSMEGQRPPEKVINKAAEMVADKVADED